VDRRAVLPRQPGGGQTLPLAAIVARLEASGYNVVPVFGYPYETPLKLLLDETARAALT
jgi:cobaltochelatase CobN